VFDIVGPITAPQRFIAPLAGVQHPLAPAVADAVRRHGSSPISLWKVINGLANAQNPASRALRRSWRLRYLCACRELLRFKVLYRHGPLIAVSNFATHPRPKSPRRLWPSDGRSASENGGSSPLAAGLKKEPNPPQAPESELVAANQSTPPAPPEPKSARPTRSEITLAARTLAQQPRRGRKLTGWLHGRRVTRLTPIIVPGGQVLPAYFVRRGFVYALLPDWPEFEDRIFARYRAEEVEIYRSPHAALLGRLPPKPGRKRGRPLKMIRRPLESMWSCQ